MGSVGGEADAGIRHRGGQGWDVPALGARAVQEAQVKGDAVPGWVTKDDHSARCEFFRKIGAKRQSLIDARDAAIPGSAERQELGCSSGGV